MPVLVKMSVQGIDLPTYDQMSTHLRPLMKDHPGFTMHLAYPISGGFNIEEVWESQAQFEAWYSENIKPNVPADIQPEIIELHAIAQA